MIDATYEDDTAVFAVRPSHGRPVTFVVTHRSVNVARNTGSYFAKRVAPRFVVSLKGSGGDGFSTHTSFLAACRSAHYRARRYERAYSVPRVLKAVA